MLKEYARREKEFMQRAADLDLVTKERDAAKQLADDLRNQRLKEFMEGFGIISMKLKEMYQVCAGLSSVSLAEEQQTDVPPCARR